MCRTQRSLFDNEAGRLRLAGLLLLMLRRLLFELVMTMMMIVFTLYVINRYGDSVYRLGLELAVLFHGHRLHPVVYHSARIRVRNFFAYKSIIYRHRYATQVSKQLNNLCSANFW